MPSGYSNRKAQVAVDQINGQRCLGKLLSVNLNSTADQAIVLSGATKYVVRRVLVTNASADLGASLVAGGVYTAASKGGSAIVAAAQVYTALTAASKFLDLTVAITTDSFTATTLYISLSVAHGSAATADIYIFGDVLT